MYGDLDIKSPSIMVATLCHEIKNPLYNILLSAKNGIKHLKNEYRSDSEIALEKFNKIIHNSERAFKIIELLSGLTDNKLNEKDAFSVSASIVSAIESARLYTENNNIYFIFDDSDCRPIGLMSRVGFEQVVLNALKNSVDSIMELQTVSENHPGKIIVKMHDDHDGFITITVRDNGRGLSQDVLDKAFMPFMTTKPKGKGSGVGLFFCHYVITESGGSMELKSAPDQGAIAVIRIPAALSQ